MYMRLSTLACSHVHSNFTVNTHMESSLTHRINLSIWSVNLFSFSFFRCRVLCIYLHVFCVIYTNTYNICVYAYVCIVFFLQIALVTQMMTQSVSWVANSRYTNFWWVNEFKEKMRLVNWWCEGCVWYLDRRQYKHHTCNCLPHDRHFVITVQLLPVICYQRSYQAGLEGGDGIKVDLCLCFRM